MALTIKNLAAGQLTLPTDAIIYPNPAITATKSALVKNIILTNVGAVSATVNVYFYPANVVGLKRQISPKDFVIPAGAQVVLDNEITMSLVTGPDAVYGRLGAAGTVDYLVNGLERDV